MGRRNAAIQVRAKESRESRGPTLVLAAVALWIAGYLAVFFFLPVGGAERIRRGLYAGAALLRPDDWLPRWFAGASLESLAERGTILLGVGVVLAFAASAGWLLLRMLRVDRVVTRMEMTLLAIGAGLNLVSLATLALGLAGLLRRDLFLGLGIVACVCAAFTRRWAGCESGTCTLRPELASPEELEKYAWNWSPHWLWLLLVPSAMIVGAAMLPPLDFDVREYHLQAPKEFYQAGRITFLPHNVYANMPLGTEMLSLSGMLVMGDWWTGALVGKTVIGLFAPLAALLLYAAGCRLASPAAGIVAALGYLTIPWVAIISTQGLVEGAFGFFLFASFYAALIWSRDWIAGQRDGLKRGGLLALVGFLAGGAVSTKYPAVIYCAVPLAIYVAAVAFRSATARDGMKAVLVLLLGMTAGCGLWFAKNAVLTGNPTYPLLYRVFDGETRTPEKETQWQAAHRPPNYQPADLLDRLGRVTMTDPWISPLIVPLAALGLVNRRTRSVAWMLLGAIGGIFLAWWLLTHRIERFLVPVWPLAALLAGLGATCYPAAWWRKLLAGLLVVTLAYNLILIGSGAATDNRYAMPLDTLRVEAEAMDPWHVYLNNHDADEVSGVLLVGDAQPFDLEVPVQYNTVFDDSIFEQLARDRTPEEVRAALVKRGISHVYVSWPEIARYRSPGNYGITEFLQPRIFADLVSAHVLEPLPQLADHGGTMYLVVIAR